MSISYPDSFTFISDEVTQELDEAIEFAKEQGFKGFELRSMFGKQFKDLTGEDIDKIGQATRKEDLKVYGVSTPVFKCDLGDAAATNEHINIFSKSLEVAEKLGARIVRVFTFLRKDAKTSRADIEAAAKEIERLIPLVENRDMVIGIENEASCLVGTGPELKAVLDLLPHEKVGAVWDPCNPLYLDVLEHPPTEGFDSVKHRVAHIHVKDSKRTQPADGGKPTLEAVAVGDGDVDWPRHFEEIKASGYDGLLSLETHYRPKQLDEQTLHLPGGYAFSHGGKQATLTCLDRVRGML